jgi:Family of unknown function (DUF6328)
MTKLKDKIKTALDESRMLILGSQVLVGFDYRSAFEKGFAQLSTSSQLLKLGSLAILLVTIALLMSPGAYHRIVHKGEDTHDVHRFTTRVMDWALLPFALAMGVELGVATGMLGGRAYGWAAGLSAFLVSVFFWYGLEWLQKRRLKRKPEGNREMKKQSEQTASLHDKIEQVLIEARVVLPGAQALLGFQFATMLIDGFEKLPASSKYVHLASLALMALSIILLMAPAAYHRIVERGEDTEHFHSFASWMLLAAMAPLPLGISGDFFVVMRIVTHSISLSLAACFLILVCFYSLWFGYTLYRRRKIAQV